MRPVSIADLSTACRDATVRFRRGESPAGAHDASGPCFELFRRAVAERDHGAWEALMAQYGGLVLAWVRRHPATATLPAHDQDDDWVTAAFERFWIAIGPDRFGHFTGLSALLRYLKMCVHSALVDAVRAHAAAPTVSLSVETGNGHGTASGAAAPHATHSTRGGIGASTALVADAEAQAADRLAAGDLWQTITCELSDETERLVAHLSLVLDLKPAEIHERFPHRFASVADVYRIKRNLLERLRRSEAILRLAGTRAAEITR